ncbi:hypothetical protein [Luteolibacter luteus]|uniref:DUF4114 domain-containing protein n=1 Tax=Luteolibacter luteus TaxID=2728835 RepID=A0A858RL37_9BACT|nr:hypothetical protein [Luteolibacter luteus]QJE97657.1 hypothetical protein HHL09_18355 [Luteolibacter luteus]
MKTSLWATLAVAVSGASALFSGIANGADSPEADPALPVGTMTAFPTLVQTGTHPTLTWNIMHPSKVTGALGGGGNGNGGGGGDGTETAAVINPPGTIIPTQDLYVTVQIVGTGPTACQAGTTVPPSDLRLSLNGGSYQQLFYGTQSAVNSSQRLYVKKVSAYNTVNLAGRYVTGTSWSPLFTTRSANMQVISLVNGELLPTASKMISQGTMANYLKPYLDANNRVKIGPLSVLVLMELGSTNYNSSCFDYQDQVALVTFSRKHPNNGHGNNLDGVDSSNPGNGKGGPNGAVDPSGGYDDEAR